MLTVAESATGAAVLARAGAMLNMLKMATIRPSDTTLCFISSLPRFDLPLIVANSETSPFADGRPLTAIH